MGKYTIIADGKRINMFDRELGVDLSLRDYISDHCFSTIINKVGFFITGDNNTLITEFESYFERKTLVGFQGPVIFLLLSPWHEQDDISDQIYRIEARDNIEKAVYNDNFLYLSDGVAIKVNKGLHFVWGLFKENSHLSAFMPYLIRIIEGLVIEIHLKMGFFPIHSSLVAGMDGECDLIMGDSQSGKTTTARLLCSNSTYRLLSDDITFIDGNGYAYPYGQYCKVISDKDEGQFCEPIRYGSRTINRKIYKIGTCYMPYKIRSIVLPQIIAVDTADCERLSNEDVGLSLNRLLDEYPNKWFMYSEYNDVLAYRVKLMLSKNRVFRMKLKYQSDNTEIEKIWENKCII